MPSNRWNRVVYRAWAPVYDAVLERAFRPGRVRAAQVLALRPGERVLLVGVGTGQDLPYIPGEVEVVGVDLSEAMLRRARARAEVIGRAVRLTIGDAAALDVPNGSFDAAVLSLILSVAPQPDRVVAETMRALRPGGRAVVFDKFAPEGRPVSAVRRVVSAGSRLLGTDVDRRLGDLLAGQPCEVVSDDASIAAGQYRVILLRRDDRAWHEVGRDRSSGR